MTLLTVALLALLLVAVILALVEVIVRLDAKIEAEPRRMTTWQPPTEPGKPNERGNDRAGD